MTYNNTLELFDRTMVYGCTIPAVLAVIVYAGVKWRATLVGKALMIHTFAIAAILTISSLRLLNVLRTPPRLLNAVLYAWLFYALWRYLITLIIIRRKGGKP